MVVIKIRIESTHSGPAGGFFQLSIDDEKPVSELITLFCSAKNVPMETTYAIVNTTNVVFDGRKSISFYNVENNELLHLGSVTDEGKTYNFCNWFKLAALAHFIGLAGLIVCVIIFLKARDIPDSYSIVLDAGSTHTDLIAYSWPGSKINSTGQVHQLRMCTIQGGIAHIKPENVSNYLHSCFESTVSVIPETFQGNSQVIFGATAGLRVLNETKPKEVAQILDELKKYFKVSNLDYKEENVLIISGTVEGVSGWITTNYLQDTFLPKVKEYQSWGSLDLGGASTQIAFQVNETTAKNINSSVVVPVTLFGQEHKVVSQSFLCYGVVEAMNRYRALLILEENEDGDADIISPCEPKDYNITVPSETLFGTLCFSYTKPGHANYTFKGTGDYDSCKRNMTTLLSAEFCRKYGLNESIDLGFRSESFVNQPFIAHSAFGYVVDDLDLLANCTQTEFVDSTKKFCKHSLPHLKKISKPKTAHDRGLPIRELETLCFKAVYSFILLTDVYNFTQDEWSNIRFQNEIDGSSLGWSLGYMVNATEKILPGDPIPKLNVLAFSFLVVLFAVFVLVSVGLVVHAVRIRNSASYERFQNNS